jgi:flagellar FliL protein
MAAIDISEGEASETTQRQAGRSGKRRVIVASVIAVLVLGGGAGATLYFFYPNLLASLGILPPLPAGAAKAKERPKDPPNYVELGEPFVVNFAEGNRVRYLQVKIEAMTRDPGIVGAIQTHLPRIRNDLLFLLSGVDYPTLSTVAGKEQMRAEALAKVQAILKEEIGKPGVEALYFTSFVVQ